MNTDSPLKPLSLATETFNVHRPTFSTDETRRDAFLQIGRCLEETTRENAPCDLKKLPCPLASFLQERTVRALYEMDVSRLSRHQVRLWQMYNSGVIVNSDDVLVGFDILPLPRFFGWPEPEGLTERIASLLDMLVITHRHEDHFDRPLVAACLRKGKPVMMPDSLAFAWGTDPNLHAVHDGWEITLDDIHMKARQGFHVWRESIDDVPLMYFEVTCQEGFRFIFGGDIDYTKRFEKTPDLDIDLFFLPWRNPNEFYEDAHPLQKGSTLDAVKTAVERIKPKAILYEHCAELDHVYGGFPASYDIALGLKEKLGLPSELMFWGESIGLAP